MLDDQNVNLVCHLLIIFEFRMVANFLTRFP